MWRDPAKNHHHCRTEWRGQNHFCAGVSAARGGHDIPEATIRRRFAAGLQLFRNVYQPLVDQWTVYDNAGDEPILMDWSNKP
jgi:hypothetical protein